MRRRAEDMDPEKDEPIDRDAWRRLLATDEDTGAPSQLTDRRILAEARRARRPRMTRWYLPASLAASLLLAVVLVRWQLEETTGTPPVTESDVLPTQAPVTVDEIKPAATPAPQAAPQRQDEAPLPSGVPPPLPELPARESRTVQAVVPGPQESAQSREEPATMKSAVDAPVAAPAQAETPRELRQSGTLTESAGALRAPEEWYADIEALRAAGRIEEANAELARLEAAWPGWLARHHPQNH